MAERRDRPGSAAADEQTEKSGERDWRPGGYGGPIPAGPRKDVSDKAGVAPGGAAPAGNASRSGKS